MNSPQTFAPAVATQARLAVVAFSSLGDGLLYVMMADNLRRAGFAVSYFGDLVYQLRAWLPQLDIRPYPARDQFDQTLGEFDLVICSPPQFMRDNMTPENTEILRRKWLLVCQKAPDTWVYDHTEANRERCPAVVHEQLAALLKSAGSIRYKRFDHESVVDITLDYMRTRMGLAHVDKQVALTPPASLIHRRYAQRVVISPDSAGPEKKDWTPSRFLRLGKRLRARGYEPHIVVAPKNHERWQTLVDGQLPVPRFERIDALAAFIYESRCLIANDSGNGHLASFLGIPTITIYRKQNAHYHWRPDWAAGTVVCPRLTLPWLSENAWKAFIPTHHILDAVDRYDPLAGT
ncbi:MAG: hypothetical protein CVU34_08990 [Betaproteobacteria bacterium HGW-Betaproteobacteria-7]|jgi:hypothetical protein|nr:MAG: hypothetical protein CVU34_08990 [Betaproteobacteria bacterium HGW-Betaproteobacteria-7]